MKNDPSMALEEFKKLYSSVVKDLRTEKKEITLATLVEAITAKSGSKPPGQNVEVLAAQKEKLLKNLSELEEKACEDKADSLNIAAFLTNLLRERADASLEGPLKKLKTVLRGDPELDDVMTVFDDLKSAAADAPVGVKAPKKTSAQASVENEMNEFSSACLKLIDELKLALGEDYLAKLGMIEEAIKASIGITDYTDVIKDVHEFLQLYTDNMDRDREGAAVFIIETGKKIAELESYFLDTLVYARDSVDGNASSEIDEHLNELLESAKTSGSLNELRDTVFDKLEIIREVMEGNRQDDLLHKQDMDKQIENTRQHLDKMNKDVEAANQKAKELQKEINLDAQTGVYSKRAFGKRIKAEADKFLKTGKPFSMLIFRVDGFRDIVDRFGRRIGDKCLVETINRIKPGFGGKNFLARIADDEFASIIAGKKGKETANLGEKIRAGVEKIEFVIKKEKLTITVSIGVAESKKSNAVSNETMKRCEVALLTAVKKGGNRVVLK